MIYSVAIIFTQKINIIQEKNKSCIFCYSLFFNEYYTMQKMLQNGDYECENIVCKMYNFQDRKEKIFS